MTRTPRPGRCGPWVALTTFGIPFDETLIRLGRPDTERPHPEHSPPAQGAVPDHRLPATRSGNRSRSASTWPSSSRNTRCGRTTPPRARGRERQRGDARRLRATCASDMPMNITTHAPGTRPHAGRCWRTSRASRRSGQECLARIGGPFLFGDFGIADAMFAPVAMRFNILRADWRPARAYAERVTALPAVARWIEDAWRRRDEYLRGRRRVRDALLGLPVRDRDWVVVGATPEQMVAQGYLPVGKDFPGVPASARRTRNTRSRAPSARPRPAITASRSTPRPTSRSKRTWRGATSRSTRWRADEPTAARSIDPFDGRRDLRRARCCAMSRRAFAEDPVRILRVARFAARFADFTVAPETDGADARDGRGRRGRCAGARARLAGTGARPDGGAGRRACSRCCATAARSRACCPRSTACGACRSAPTHHPEVDTGVHLMMVLDMAARAAMHRWPVRFACLATTSARARRRPTCCRATSATSTQRRAAARRCASAGACRATAASWPRWSRASTATSTAARASAPAALVRLLERCDALRKPARFAEVLLRLRMRRARPARAGRAAVSAAAAPAARRWLARAVDGRGRGGASSAARASPRDRRRGPAARVAAVKAALEAGERV